jgi:hypothetical protein
MIVLAAIFLLIGTLVSWIGWSGIVRSLRLRAWPVSEAVIVSSRVAELGSGSSRWGRLEVSYTYDADGRTCTGHGIHPRFQGGGRRDELRALADLLPVGTRVQVRWNPQRPDVAWLNTRILPEQWPLVWFGALFLLAGIFVGAFDAILLAWAHLSVIGTLRILP